MTTADTMTPVLPATPETEKGAAVRVQRFVRGHIVATLILGDCHEMLPMKCDAIVCDPPYPDYHAELYGYTDGLLEPLRELKCRQLIFWSPKVDFPLDYTAIHVWDKVVGVGSMYERIFERNGNKQYKLYRAHPITCEYIAMRSGEQWTEHPSQKPQHLMKKLVAEYTNPGDTVLDPWMGGGSTGLACMITGRNFVGIEKNPTHYATACSRLEREINQGVLL